MIAKILVGVVAVIGLAGGGYYAAGDAANCCYPGSGCCFLGSPCCDDTTAPVVEPNATSADGDCCVPAAPCCPGPCCDDAAK